MLTLEVGTHLPVNQAKCNSVKCPENAGMLKKEAIVHVLILLILEMLRAVNIKRLFSGVRFQKTGIPS